MSVYTGDDALRASEEYFKGDDFAAGNFVSKYALRNKEGKYVESTPLDMHVRLAKEFARIEKKYPESMSEKDILELLTSWRVVPQGSPMSGIGNDVQLQSLSNCFVIESPYDSYGGILKTDQEQAQIMKRRGGVGFDISTIRPRGLITANAARTTDGIGVFMERFSNTCREVAQGGRRGALMLTVSVHHPEIRTFINIKKDKKKVTGANISIRLTDEFMQAVKEDKNVQLRFPVEKDVQHLVEESVSASELWDEIIHAAWESAEPGLLFWDTIRREGPADAYPEFRSVSTNPCITGDSLIAVADGRNAVSIRALAKAGFDVPVYSTNVETGQVEIKMGRSPRMTKQSAEIWKLTLDDGSTFSATPDHKVMLRDRSYVELQNLKPGMSVFPFSSFNSNGYRQVCNTGMQMSGGARRSRRQYRLIHDFVVGVVDPKIYAIHHIDFDSFNDSIQNLRVMTHADHHELHAHNMRGEKNPYHKQGDDWKRSFASHPGVKNGRYMNVTNEQLLDHGRKLFVENGRITANSWTTYAKSNSLPQFLGNDFRFGSWQNFANQVAENHKVISVERVGTEDVFNITVDDNHNYHVITSNDDDRFVVSSGLCVKNCGEITLSPYDSCRLMLVNLVPFVRNEFTDKAWFDADHFWHTVYKAQRLMDDLVDLELEVIDKVIKKIIDDPEPDDVKRIELDLWQKIKNAATRGRRTGLGITGLGDALAYLNIKYGSDESVKMTDEIYSDLADAAYTSSVHMAEQRGAFPAFSRELEKGHPFLDRVLAVPELRRLHDLHGRRNIALTTTAPAGTVSTLTMTSSGCEPAFLISYKRKKKINANDSVAKVDFVDAMGDKWTEHDIYHHGFKRWQEVTGLSDPKLSPYWEATSADIDWVKKIDVQAAAQRWICHSISNTTNIPNETSVDVVKQIYMKGWETGCKGVTIYRAGSRDGVLTALDEPKKASPGQQPAQITDTHAPKRPRELVCDIHRSTIQGNTYIVIVGLLDGRPYEVFAGRQEHVEVPKKIRSGVLIKNGRNKDGVATYNLKIVLDENDDDCLLFKDIVNLFDDPIHGALTRTISLALRHGVPVQYVVEQLRKDKHSDIVSFSKCIARVLSKSYIADGTVSTMEKSCPDCNGQNLSYQQGCVTCLDCGTSKCG